MKKQKAMALVLVLWIVSLLTIMAASYALTIRREISVISAIKNNAELISLAEAGLNVAGAMLFHQDNKNKWRADGSIYSFNINDVKIRLRIFSESGKVDINKADEQLLLAILQTTSANENEQLSIVDSILDWRDKDDLIHINGAETKQYLEAGLNYQPLNKDFQSIEELQLVLGITEDIYSQIEPLITVYSKQKMVDLKVASKQVIEAVSKLDTVLLDNFIAQRQESNRLKEAPPGFPLATESQNQSTNTVFTVYAQAQATDNTKAGIRATITKPIGINSTLNYKLKLFNIVDWNPMLEQKDSLFTKNMAQFLINLNADTE